jgi:hypothetical protein
MWHRNHFTAVAVLAKADFTKAGNCLPALNLLKLYLKYGWAKK